MGGSGSDWRRGPSHRDSSESLVVEGGAPASSGGPPDGPLLAGGGSGGGNLRSVTFLTAMLMGVALCFHSLLEGAAMGAQATIRCVRGAYTVRRGGNRRWWDPAALLESYGLRSRCGGLPAALPKHQPERASGSPTQPLPLNQALGHTRTHTWPAYPPRCSNSLHIFIAIVSHKGLAAYALGSSIVDSEARCG